MTQPTTPPRVCEACAEPVTPNDAIGAMHPACVERLLARLRRQHQRTPALKLFLPALVVAGAVLAGCGQTSSATPTTTTSQASAPALDGPCTPERVGSRTVAADPVLVCTDTASGPRWVRSSAELAAPTTTTTTVCPAGAIATKLQADQVTQDSLIGGRRQAESSVAQIQLVIDNTSSQIDIARRYVEQRQAEYNSAANVYKAVPRDTNHDKLVAAERYLADAKDVLAQWQAVRTKALGDLSLGKATLADWDKQIAAARQAVAADKAAQGTLTCS